MQEEGMMKVEQLKAELTALQEVKREEKRKGMALQEAHTTLSEELEKEKVRVQVHVFLVTVHSRSAEDQPQCRPSSPQFVLTSTGWIRSHGHPNATNPADASTQS